MTIIEPFLKTSGQVGHALAANWPFLLASAVVAAALKLHASDDRVGAFLRRHRRGSVVAATAAAVTTPLCSCGTTAVVLGMLAGSMPWAPIVAFMVASPLTSPQELFYSAGLFGWPFAGAFFVASILLGLLGGLAGHLLESRGWLAGQSRLRTRAGTAGAATLPILPAPAPARPRPGLRALAGGTYAEGRRLLAFFLAFASIGYLLNDLVPTAWVTALFGGGRVYGVPLAATLGVPFYLNTEASLPLVRGLLDAGMSSGAALAFLITGAGTSIGAVAGALAIARWRVVGLVVATLWLGAVACGFTYDALQALGRF
jgi:uncharacterized protein